MNVVIKYDLGPQPGHVCYISCNTQRALLHVRMDKGNAHKSILQGNAHKSILVEKKCSMKTGCVDHWICWLVAS